MWNELGYNPLPHHGDCWCSICTKFGAGLQDRDIVRTIELRKVRKILEKPSPVGHHRCNCLRCDWHEDTPGESAVQQEAAFQRKLRLARHDPENIKHIFFHDIDGEHRAKAILEEDVNRCSIDLC
jgi:hypothetical protein